MPPPADGFAARLVLGPALRTQPDRRLVALVRDGYETAFDEIVRRYGDPLRRYAATIVGGRSEDITQDAFSKALLALRRDGAEIELRPWLFRIVRNTALNDLRDAPPSPEVLAETLAGGRNPAEELERREELAELIERLQSLPEPQRAAIVMRELEGLGHEEIAAALGLSGGAARQAIYRARQTLRDGFGMLLPVPLLKALLSGSSSASMEAAAAAGGAGGAGVALKATTATVLVAGAVGAGVAMNHGHRHERPASAGVGRVDTADPSRVGTAGLRPGTAGDGSPAETEQGADPEIPDDRHDAGERRSSIKQGDGHGGREGHPTPLTGQGGGDRGGKDAAGPTNSGDEGGGSSGRDESPSSGDSPGGSSGPGGGSGNDGDGGGGGSSGPGDGTTAPISADESPDAESSNSGPGSGDDGTGRSPGSDDQRDPHGATVFSVQETQP
jgi:RNA polymerase sigma factor (sigma-70 family)